MTLFVTLSEIRTNYAALPLPDSIDHDTHDREGVTRLPTVGLLGCDTLSNLWDRKLFFIKTAIKRFPTRRSPHQILSDGVILIARLAQGIRGECVRTLWELFTSLITILNLATATLMVVTSHALKINDHFNSSTLSMAAHVTRAAPLPTFVSCHHFKLYHLALVSRCFARRSCSHLHH